MVITTDFYIYKSVMSLNAKLIIIYMNTIYNGLKNLLLFIFAITCIPTIAQEKKPTLMVLPSDNWCTQRYFISNFENQGVEVSVPNYPQAFAEDTELCQVISKIGALLTDCGYSLKDAEQEVKSLNTKTAEDNATASKTSGASLAESPLDILKRRVKTDIILQIWWKVNKDAGKRSVSFTLEAFDSYTNKRIATSTGTTKPSSDITPILLEKAVKENIKPFDTQLCKWYEEQKIKGREIILNIKRWDSWENDLETEYDGEELIDCINTWLDKNCVNGSYNLTDNTENNAQYEQVRIPLTDEKGKAMDARSFINNLRKYLQKEPFNITSKLMIRGLGEATLVLGEK